MTQFKGVIFDIDGTLILNNQPLPGATDAVNGLRSMGVQLRFVTNTTGRTPEQLGKVLRELGFEVQDSEILTSVGACVHFLKQNYVGKAGYLAIPEEIEDQFAGIAQTTENPAFVVMGDLDKGFDYDVLNRVFNYMRNGAQLITFHRNRFFFRDGKTWLDSGAFTLALERSCDQEAIVTGKPAPQMFQGALQSMSLPKQKVIVIGDDVSSDILGAKQAGLQGFLVTTGKFKPEQMSEHDLSSDCLLHNVGDVITMCASEE
ncbi:TIGR01458 family HAD-type hydrolase [Vibrio ostreicida]|uniref:Haloacid dehalogenase-like hydrolase domain-containing protein 2 n=1 Tax=Vibrio ostreicida TaxID=526588 RepID=A0ABT8BUL2_9VIBR|nr:TIGR01458 family HAD-type hydrolase [Vibrio ostreicida]MDN3609760.1 TIGR01458 family HAD-type hydrolase [Vibrio ostreicida]NPD09410.1 TIGR01458 family HAD-type hydrolase [Vibrio ostreicida]